AMSFTGSFFRLGWNDGFWINLRELACRGIPMQNPSAKFAPEQYSLTVWEQHHPVHNTFLQQIESRDFFPIGDRDNRSIIGLPHPSAPNIGQLLPIDGKLEIRQCRKHKTLV